MNISNNSSSDNSIKNHKQTNNEFRKLFTESKNWTPPIESLNYELIKTISDLENCTLKTILEYSPTHNSTLRESIANRNRDRFIQLKEINNLNKNELASLNKLKNLTDVIIKPADKGSATVLMNRLDYISEAERQLNNNKYYIRLKEPIYHNNVKKIHSILLEMFEKKYISKEQLKYLSGPSDYRPRVFYLLPKIHKKQSAWPNPKMPEGRPIVSDVNSETYRVSELIDYYLNPLATKHFSYIKNSFEFVNKIKNTMLDKDCLLVTGDISSLYTNMNIDRMLECTRRAFHDNPDKSRPDDQLLRLLEISLKYNDFQFNGQCFQQILGCAMGKRFAPALANLYLLEFDLKATTGFSIKPLLFWRYLDDVFFIWPGDVDSLKEYESYLNSLIPGIKITLEHHTDKIPFLDTEIYKQDNTLHTRTYFKPTDTHQLLHTDSFHPKHTFRGLLKSQLIRFKRLSSTKQDYDITCKELFSHLTKRGYKHNIMRKLKTDIWNSYTNDTPTQNNSNSNLEKLPIIVDYCTVGTKLAKSYKSVLNENSFFKNHKLVTAYTNNKNLKQILVRSELPQVSNSGAYLCCDQPRCMTCRIHAVKRDHFHSERNKNRFTIKDNIYCSSKNLIYLITCRKCKMQYVGETGRSLRDRLNDHRSSIRNKLETPIALHFNSPNHSMLDLSIVPIELIKNTTSFSDSCRKNRERFWQLKLNTLFPNGINNTPIVYTV